MSDDQNLTSYIKLAAEIVSAYVSNNTVAAADVPGLLADINTALVSLGQGAPAAVSEVQRPAIAVKKSVTDDHIVCLEDGKKFKSLKRHLRTQYNMTPEEYREKWGLPGDYPRDAPAYAKARSQLAKQMGLGQQRRKRK
jgi:predicted transcriptional regulator